MDKLTRMMPKGGFTLAEMLIVLMVVSLVATASLPFAYRRSKMPKDKTPHGKFECYRKADGNLVQKRWDNNVLTTDTTADIVPITKCTFSPPTAASYFIVQAIGGGGGGAWSGAIGNAVYKDQGGSIVVPIDGSLPSSNYSGKTPDWVYDAINNDTNGWYKLSVTVYGGGGGGGAGAWSTPTLVTPASCGGEMNNKVPITGECSWAATPYSGGAGGVGGSASITDEIVRTTKTIKATGGLGGGRASCGPTTASGGDPGKILVNGTEVASSGYGTGGTSATPTNMGGTSGTTVGDGGSGGASGGAGSGDPVAGSGSPFVPSGKPWIWPNGCKEGEAGGNGSAAITLTTGTNNGTSVSFPFTFKYVEKTMPYAEGGYAGNYVTMFLRKLSSNLVISVGKGGLGGTSASDYNADSIKGDGQGYLATATNDEFSTKVGTFLIAKGGAGGKQQYTQLINLYEAVADASYFNNYLTTYGINASYSAYTVTLNGKAGIAGSYASLRDPQAAANPELDAHLGEGGAGGGSTSGVGFNMTRLLNVVHSYTAGTYPAGCTNDATNGAPGDGLPGKSGAVVIVW